LANGNGRDRIALGVTDCERTTPARHSALSAVYSSHINRTGPMTTTINNREFTLTENTEAYPNLRAFLIKKGFDGTLWTGFSARTGRQRKDLHSMIYRTNSGRFVIGGAA
jgi:hypothetical protein